MQAPPILIHSKKRGRGKVGRAETIEEREAISEKIREVLDELDAG